MVQFLDPEIVKMVHRSFTYSDVPLLTFELESQHLATAVQLFKNKDSQIFSGGNEMKCDMLPTALLGEQRAVGKTE